MENKLPKNWVETELGNYAILKNGYAFKSNDFQNEGVPIVRISNIQENKIDIENSICVDESKLKSDFIISKGDILIAMSGATTGKYGVFEQEVIALQNQRVGNLKPVVESLSNKRFLLYLLGSLKKEIEERAYGGAQPNISPRLIESIKINLPPLAEQSRIVAKLDTLFAQLETIKASMAKVPLLLKDFRQQVLDKEFKLNCKKIELKDICLKIQDGAHHSPKVTYEIQLENTFPYITSKNIRNNYMKLDNVQYVDFEFHNTIYPRCTPEFGDVLLTKDGANTGNVTLNELKVPFSLLSSVCLIKTDKEKLIPAYLKFYFQSNIGFNELIGEMTGTAIKRIVLKKIKITKIPTPNIEKQQEIVLRVESLFAKADAIEKQYENLKAKIDSLPQAILHKAFKGELSQQLDSDGDARELLASIQSLRAERGNHTTKRKKVKQAAETALSALMKAKNYAENEEVLGMVAETKEDKSYESL